jgi:hypothetical protein
MAAFWAEMAVAYLEIKGKMSTIDEIWVIHIYKKSILYLMIGI